LSADSIGVVFHYNGRRDSGDDISSDDTIRGELFIAVVRYPNLALSGQLLCSLEGVAHPLKTSYSAAAA
jgi:hypothetical protein